MSDDRTNRPTLTRTGLLISALALTLPFLADAIVFGGSGQADQIWREPGILIGNAVYAMLPFALVDSAMRPRRRVRIALWTGFALTVLLWAGYAWGGWDYQANDGTGGANIGLGILLMVWPIALIIFMGLLAKVGEKEVANV